MSPTKRMLKTYPNGHKFYKSSDYPTCPVCEAARKPDAGFLADLSAPARLALESEGITTLKKLASHTESEIRTLHGMGPSSIPKLKKALRSKDLTFKAE
jgi:hypothetical protein